MRLHRSELFTELTVQTDWIWLELIQLKPFEFECTSWSSENTQNRKTRVDCSNKLNMVEVVQFKPISEFEVECTNWGSENTLKWKKTGVNCSNKLHEYRSSNYKVKPSLAEIAKTSNLPEHQYMGSPPHTWQGLVEQSTSCPLIKLCNNQTSKSLISITDKTS